jgi:lipopolysaccharide transport system ATP-binding protein
MSTVAIRADRLSKQYRIGTNQFLHDTLRDQIVEGLAALFGRDGRPRSSPRTIWALKDVSLEIKQGEAVGIIGRNGAGKSTLLKIFSRITEPTAGRAWLHGRIGSLLEVGTGFHSELTGRENVYLSGAILGMTKAEIDRNFDAIVAFSEVEPFIDTPVKRYSSGMYLRLAFAVAAHLQPEILIVDEVLAVGDVNFQKKCLNKLEEVEGHGRTVLFVSHNMPTITRICRRAVLLDEGRVVQDGRAPEVVARYLSSGGSIAAREWGEAGRAPGNELVRLCAVRVRAENGEVSDTVDIRRPVGIETEYEVLTPGKVLVASLALYNEDNVCVFVADDRDPEWWRRPRPLGRFVSTAWIPGNFLAEGMLMVRAAIITEAPFLVHCDEFHTVSFQVIDSAEGDSARGDYAGPMMGVVRPLLKWTTRFTPRLSVSDKGKPRLAPGRANH